MVNYVSQTIGRSLPLGVDEATAPYAGLLRERVIKDCIEHLISPESTGADDLEFTKTMQEIKNSMDCIILVMEGQSPDPMVLMELRELGLPMVAVQESNMNNIIDIT